MPISAEQWRATTGSLNAGKGSLRPRPSFKPSFPRCDLLPPPPASWKGYYTAIVVLCTPLFYKMYLVGVAILMYLVSCPGANILTSGPYSSIELTADVSTSFMNQQGGVPLLFATLNVLLYVAMVITVVLFGVEEHRGREKHQWMLTQQLHHLDLFWLNSGPDCEVIFDPNTCSMYATLSMNGLHLESVLKCVHMTCDSKRREKRTMGNVGQMIGVVSFFLQLSTLVVVAMLLLLAGDVERNPGPPPGLDLATLTRELSSAKDKWHEIGVQLHIEHSQLSAIEDMYPYIDRRLSEMLNFWLEGNADTRICWESILKCLRADTVNKRGLAEELQQKYCQQLEEGPTKRPRSSSAHQSEEASGDKEFSSEQLLTKGALQSVGTEKGGECSPGPKKLRYSFPYFDLSKCFATEGDSEALQAKLCNDFEYMTKSFQDLMVTVGNSLEKRKKSTSNILACVSQFKTLEPVYTDLQNKQSEFRHRFPELKKATSISEAMNVISDYSSFFNYCLVEQIVLGLGTDEDKAKLKEYETEFQKHAERFVFECPPELGVTGKDCPSFFVKVHHKGFEECSINHLRHFTSHLAKILNLPIGLLVLDSVAPGCLELIVQVPQPSYRNVFPLSSQQEQDLAALGVIKISAGDYQYLSSHDEGDDSHHIVDRPDGGSSESGFDTLSSVLSELSELKQDMIDRNRANPYDFEFQYDPEAQRQPDEKKTSTSIATVTPLHIAAYHGRLDSVQKLVETNMFSPMEKDQIGDTALHYAVEGKHMNVLKYFIENLHCNPGAIFGAFGETPLHLAARLGSFVIVKYLIDECEVDPMNEKSEDIHSEDCHTSLHSACLGGNLRVIRYLVKKFEHFLDTKRIVTDTTKQGLAPLHYASACGHTEVVIYFITELKCDPNIPGRNQMTPLHYAAQEGQVDTMKYLIDSAKCNPSQVEHYKATPLHYAAAYGQLEAVKLLTLDKGCDPSCRNCNSNTPLHDAARLGHLNVVKFFITELKCDPNIPGKYGAKPLHCAAQGGHVDIIKYLIDSTKCNPLPMDDNNCTPLHFAVAKGQLQAVKVLTLDYGFDPSCRDADSTTPLHLVVQGKSFNTELKYDPSLPRNNGLTHLHGAALGGHINVVKFFITELNCDASIPGKYGTTPLHCAAQGGHVDIMKYLIDNEKCSPSQVNNVRFTPLHSAAANGQLEAVKLLTLDYGCDPCCRDTDSDTSLYLAALGGHLNVVKFFTKELNCDPSILGEKGLAPLHAAAQGGHVDTMKYLIDNAKCNPSLRSSKGITPLHSAARFGKLEAVKLLTLDKGCDPSCRDVSGFTPLHHAAYGGHVEIVKFFITELKCDPNTLGIDCCTPLHCSAQDGHVDTMRYLIDNHKCNPSQMDNVRFTPLHVAAAFGQLEAVKLLTSEKDCDPFCRNIRSNTPLHLAAFHGHLNVVKFFITELKCDPNIPGNNGVTPLHCAARGEDVDTMIQKYLIDSAKYNPLQLNNVDTTTLHTADSHAGQLDVVKLLTVDKRCDPFCRDADSSTPLHHAAIGGNINVVKFFITELNCNPNIPGRNGAAPLHYAAQKGHMDIMRYLIDDAKCIPSTQDYNKTTPLHIAAAFGQLDAVKLLIDKGCDPSCKNSRSSTPLYMAAQRGRLNVIKFLITELKCDASVPGKNGLTPLHVAAENGHVDTMKYLIDSAKCNPSQVDNDKATPLHYAASHGQLKAVTFLTLEKGCDPMCRDTFGRMPLYSAAIDGHLNIVKFYVERLHCPPDVPAIFDATTVITPMQLAMFHEHNDIVQYLKTVLLVQSGINFYSLYLDAAFSAK